jgi:hypothetical protein
MLVYGIGIQIQFLDFPNPETLVSLTDPDPGGTKDPDDP